MNVHQDWRARLYKRLFWHFLKARPDGSLWSWHYLESICKHRVVRHETSQNGWVDMCDVCDTWLAYDLTNTTKMSWEPESAWHEVRDQKGICLHTWLIPEMNMGGIPE